MVIIGVGDGLTTEYVECLTQTDDDFIPVGSFSEEDLESIMGSLSNILCPTSKQFKVTEVKAAKKENGWDYRLSRFIEIYNTGIDFNTNDITLSGLVTGTGPNVTVSQGQYVVFYDAEDVVGGSSIVTCHLCGDECDLSNCANTEKGYDGACWCGNSLYIACSNIDNTQNSCSYPTGSPNGNSASNGCSLCTFNNPVKYISIMCNKKRASNCMIYKI